MTIHRTLVACILGAVLVLLVGGTAALGRAGDGQDLGAMSLPDKAHPKLETSLARLAEAQRRGGSAAARGEAGRQAIPLRDGRVRVVVRATAGEETAAAAWAQAVGASVEATSDGLVQVLAPIAALEALAAGASVDLVRLPLKPVPVVTGQGVSLIKADDWHNAGISGSGVNVAVLDLGFEGYTSLLGSELPSSVTVRSFRADQDITGGGEPHGTAVAEVVHEVAPGAAMYLVNFGTEVELSNAVDWLISEGVEVINFSVGYFGSGPGDGTGSINDIVNRAVSSGIFWSSAAGNQARRHWSGDWRDDDDDSWHNFAAADEGNDVSLSAGTPITVILKWDDPFGGSCNDYDLYLFDSGQQVVASSTYSQSCNSDPVEALTYSPSSSGTYSIGINRYSASGISNFDLYTFRHDLEYQTAAGSLVEPADNPNAMSVGAVPWYSPDNIELFSSRGPTKDGRIKPDVAGPDGVSNATYGAFHGTSGAAPHGAGAAALVKQALPTYTPAQMKSFLEGRAVDLGSAGKDNTYGSGRLDLDTPFIDSDGDAFADAAETYIGTDPLDACPDDLGDDAWPLDMDNDQTVDTADVLSYAGLAAPPTVVSTPAHQRLDLNASGIVDTADVLNYAGLVSPPTTCT